MRNAFFLSGAAALALIWLGPLPRLAAHSFSAHMTMHMGVVAVAAPLLAIGTSRRRRSVPGKPAFAAALAASVVELLVVWSWHTPALHHAARTSTGALVAEQATFLTSAYIVWCLSLRGGAYPSAGAGAGVVALLLTSMHMTLLGALIALAPRPLYAHFAGSAGALEDQQLGGAIMLLVGGAVYLAGGVAIAARLVRMPATASATETRA